MKRTRRRAKWVEDAHLKQDPGRDRSNLRLTTAIVGGKTDERLRYTLCSFRFGNILIPLHFPLSPLKSPYPSPLTPRLRKPLTPLPVISSSTLAPETPLPKSPHPKPNSRLLNPWPPLSSPQAQPSPLNTLLPPTLTPNPTFTTGTPHHPSALTPSPTFRIWNPVTSVYPTSPLVAKTVTGDSRSNGSAYNNKAVYTAYFAPNTPRK